MARWRYKPDIAVGPKPELIRLGSDYGGWQLEPSADLQHSTILSCGLGEDASFDVEFANRFNARVILVDPTPRAIEHYRQISAHFGEAARQPFVRGGKQEISCYDLKKLDANHLVLEPYAIWNKAERLRFFCPVRPTDVSHSIVNIQNNFSADGAFIEVEAMTIDYFVNKYQLTDIPLIKLDVEGAEVEVLRSIMERGVYPRQLLVEFDEINTPGTKSKQRVEAIDRELRTAGYTCRHGDRANFLYIRG